MLFILQVSILSEQMEIFFVIKVHLGSKPTCCQVMSLSFTEQPPLRLDLFRTRKIFKIRKSIIGKFQVRVSFS